MEVRNGSQSSGSNSVNIDKLLEQGLTIYSEGKIEEAIKVWNKVLAVEPNNKIAQEYIKTAKSDLYETKLSAGTDIETDTGENDFYDPEISEQQFDMASDDVSNDQQSTAPDIGIDKGSKISEFMDRGDSFFEEKKFEKAINEWKKALEITPADSKIKSKIDKAKSAIEAAPFIANCTRKGQEYFEQGDYNSAISEWKKILSIESDNQEIIGNIRMTEMLIQKAPKDISRFEEGKKLFDGGDFRGAVSIFEEILGDDPDNEQAIQLYLKAKSKLESSPEKTEGTSDFMEPDDIKLDLDAGEDSEIVITRTSDYDQREPDKRSSDGWEPVDDTTKTATVPKGIPKYEADAAVTPTQEKFPLKLVLFAALTVVVISGILYLAFAWKNSTRISGNTLSPKNTALEIAEKRYNEGLVLFDQGKYDEALYLFNQSLQLNPNHVNARMKQQEVEMLLDPSKLPDDQKTAYIDNLLTKAENLEKQKKYQEAQDLYQQILKLDNQHVIAKEKFFALKDILRDIEKQELYNAPVPIQLKKAKEYHAVTYYDDARDLLKNILRKDPGNREAQNLLKECEDRIKGIEQRQARADEMYQNGLVFFKEGKYDQAIAVWRNVLLFDPSYRLADKSLKEAVTIKKKKEEAMELQRGGEFYYDIGKYETALEKFERLLALEPDNEIAKFYISKIKEYQTLGSFNQ
ncbi:MAG: hypothetical protein A2161_05565 [Candidatus Schekmanbacteria bacterium RBG_13_48_7]|uniref:Tetratricopeptide repeat protein n=1 Tax=Candidatus Schekmanbacteria bacterium RBG_13_48_7 TaxID=1817878 RepID=A0A1F7S4K5_9BACT|nr:MAG: hypothetical protein A2161_05565 [Candidatus Schekmanbacteria bacterium RBG_13_48_7]